MLYRLSQSVNKLFVCLRLFLLNIQLLLLFISCVVVISSVLDAFMYCIVQHVEL